MGPPLASSSRATHAPSPCPNPALGHLVPQWVCGSPPLTPGAPSSASISAISCREPGHGAVSFLYLFDKSLLKEQRCGWPGLPALCVSCSEAHAWPGPASVEPPPRTLGPVFHAVFLLLFKAIPSGLHSPVRQTGPSRGEPMSLTASLEQMRGGCLPSLVSHTERSPTVKTQNCNVTKMFV